MKKRKIVEVPISEIGNTLFAIRESKMLQIEPDLKQSILEDGICEPLLIKKTGRRSYEVVSGSRRFEAAKELGLEKVPAIVIKESEREAYEMSLVMKLLQNPLSLYERSVILNEILAQKIMSKGKLVTYLGITHAYLNQLLQVKDVLPTIKYALNSFQITEAECFYLMSLPEEKQEIVLENMVRDTRRDIYYDAVKPRGLHNDNTSLTLAVNTIQKAVELIGKSSHPFTYESKECDDEVEYIIKIKK